MAGWLSRATEQFRTRKPPPPEPYDVKCDCGAQVAGNRTSSAQRPACPSCGRPVFVLPQNVYPSPVKRPSRNEDSSPKSSEKSNTPAKSGKGVTEKKGRPAEAAGPAPLTTSEGVLDQTKIVLFTPLRLVAVAIVIIAGLTGWGLWYRSSIEAAKAIVLKAKEAGLKALAESDFITAARELKRARDAVDLLGRTDPDAKLIRRVCREAIAGNELPSDSYFDFLAEIGKNNGASLRLDGRSQGPWLLFDSIVLVPDTASQPCVLDDPEETDQKRFRIEINSKLIRKAVERTGDGSRGRIIFAAQIRRIAPDPADAATIVLTLNDASAFLWTGFDTYSLLGYQESSAEEQQLTLSLLARQLEQMEESQ